MDEISILKKTELLGNNFMVYGTVEEPLFLAKDIARFINHSDVSTMMRCVDDDEKVTKIVCTPGGNQQVWMLTENGLYEVLMQSRKPIAKEFKKGVKAILKEIRKTGRFCSSTVQRQASLNEQMSANILFADWSAKFLNLNAASRLLMARRIGETVGMQDTLPTAIDAGTQHPVTQTATELLRRHYIKISTVAFNRILERKGIVRKASRPSNVKGKTHNWMVLLPGFDKYGENQQDPKHQKQTQIRWYENSFGDIIAKAGLATQATMGL